MSRSRSQPAPPPISRLVELPAELQLTVAMKALASDLPSALRLRQACRALRDNLALARQRAEARRLQWVVGWLEAGHMV